MGFFHPHLQSDTDDLLGYNNGLLRKGIILMIWQWLYVAMWYLAFLCEHTACHLEVRLYSQFILKRWLIAFPIDYQSILESRKPRIKLMEKERLARESQADLAARKKVFEHSIAMRRQRGPFHETKNWPSMDVIVKLEPVKKLLEAPEGSVGPQAWISLFESLSDVIWKWQVDEQVKVRSTHFLD